MVILKKQVLKHAVSKPKEKIEIVAILNKFKNTFKNLIDSSNIEFSDIQKLVNKNLLKIRPNFEYLQTEFKFVKKF